MDTLGDYAMLVGFDQQLDYVEQMLQKADKYNIRLVTQIDNLKNLVQANQNILHNLQSNEAHMKALLEDNQKAELHAKMISCAKRLKRKLLVTVSLLDELEAEDSPIDCKEDQGSESSLSQQMNGLGPSLVSIGNELKSLSEDKLNEIREASLLSQSSCKGSSKERRCWTHCRTLNQNDLHAKELMELRKATELLFQAFNQSNSVTVEIIYRNHIMERGTLN
ncbi:PREDICTED: uncharacterized protein LOC108610542 isoform X1 [Drosophila arizonae]|uniref:Uncharacterized protein LOC108610542 isoform X1 n=1 Tax=Drosophila arizonae TaxID=7263 RepID=A0ABM1NTA5_DROAR|nr:PREDICTED: uncharacterized protein LOC108610542 isoform X1 [Drosophila arizonae]